MSIFDSGIRPVIDEHLLKLAAEKRDYGKYWSASNAGYCQRKTIFERLGVPYVETEADARIQRVFTSGHLFHAWIQGITKEAGLSIAREVELQDEELVVRGHFDDLIKIADHLILYDYKTVNSQAFKYRKDRISHYHRLQLGTYLYMVRQLQQAEVKPSWLDSLPDLDEGRIMNISKDDLRMSEMQLFWDEELEHDVLGYWNSLNEHWNAQTIPPCTCADHEQGFMARERYNPYWLDGEPCNIEVYNKFKEEKEKANVR